MEHNILTTESRWLLFAVMVVSLTVTLFAAKPVEAGWGGGRSVSWSSGLTTVSVTVDIEPSVSGTVIVDGDAPYSYPDTSTIVVGTRLHVKAVPAPGYRFVEWGGHLSGNDNPTSIKVIRNNRITAHFLPNVDDFTSEDGVLNVIIPEGTIVRDKEDAQLTGLDFTVADTLPALPLGANTIGSAYDVEPDGATFDQPIVLSWNYDPVDIPSGVAEEDLVITYYNKDAHEWVELPSQVDPENDIVTAVVDHLTTIAIMCFADLTLGFTPAALNISSLSISPQEVNTGEVVSISVLVTNGGEEEGSCIATLKINEMAVETKEQSLAGRASKRVAFTVSHNEAGTYLVDINGLPGLFVVKEIALSSAPTLACTALVSTSSTNPSWWPLVGIWVAVTTAIAVPLIPKWRQRRTKLSEGIRNRKP